MQMNNIDLTAGSLQLSNYGDSDTFHLSVRYNDAVSKDIEIRGIDNLYALQYLVNRAIQKLKSHSVSGAVNNIYPMSGGNSFDAKTGEIIDCDGVRSQINYETKIWTEVPK